MKITKELYQGSLALLTDLYQINMAYGFYKEGVADRESVFHLFFRKNPFDGGYTVVSGLEYVVDYLNNFKFYPSDLDFLATLQNAKGEALYDEGFLKYLEDFSFTCDIDAMPEGTFAFPHEPVIRVKGPMLQAQLLETPLLNMVNFQTLIATKATRITQEALGQPVLEFGLRRAQGIDGALAASRAAYIGGCESTSNVLAGKLFGIPVSGTHAHSWVMFFEDEPEAFRKFAKNFPHSSVFLVDTYDTLQGIEHAIDVASEMKDKGQQLIGIRLDSGDLAYYSQKARERLNASGFSDVKIIGSNDLDEYIIASLKSQEAAIDMWGIGTKLVTAYDQPALGAVYKLAAVQSEDWTWVPKIKLSAQSIKINNPGVQMVRRFYDQGIAVGDLIYEENKLPKKGSIQLVDPMDPARRKKIAGNLEAKDLLVPIFKKGKQVYDLPPIKDIQEQVKRELASFDRSIRRLVNPHSYPAGLDREFYQRKMDLILKMKNMQA